MSKHNTSPASIVVIGGGTGSFALLNAFKNYFDRVTALVNMSDNGGSTGVLRDELGVLPPGDIRQCLIALSKSPQVRELFNYRFEEGTLAGHAFGNLFLAALEKLTGSFAEAVETASEVLRVQGSVVPVTLNNVQVQMSWAGQRIVLRGQRYIEDQEFSNNPREGVLALEPPAVANPKALKAIAEAQLVVIAPGDLYTSIGPALVVDGIRQALQTTKAQIVYVCNLVTKHGHTDNFDVAAHADEIERMVGATVLDIVLYNTAKPSAELLKRYAEAADFWVAAHPATLRSRHYKAVGGNFLAAHMAATPPKGDQLASRRSFIRHDGVRVVKELMQLLSDL
ncbi:MAG TPA: gluconeogenesis factor YvcK family protein [Candidatus Saccharimonadales bacterium]|nr:gluconeogenesis factor YvcK family protein [Candidatus Saccharimonadales bacterium]